MTITLSRRHALWLGMGGLTMSVMPGWVMAGSADDLIAAFTQGATVTDADILRAPAEAPDGYAVPIEIKAPGATQALLLALGRNAPVVATADFGPASVGSRLATRIRLAERQQIMALARMPDGSVLQSSAHVNVLVGGCAG